MGDSMTESGKAKELGGKGKEALGADTYAREDDFYSYRRATHRGEPNYGRQISLIGIER